jgi:flagellar assembly factor FliW
MTEQLDLNKILGEESQPIEFPLGLIGLTEWHRFVLITHPTGGELRLLKSLENNRISFIVVDPRKIMPDYQLVLSEADIQALQYAGKPGVLQPDEADIAGYSILSVEEEPFKVTVNLLGPLVINWQTGLGRQVIQSDSNYDPRYPVADHSSSHSSSVAKQKKEEV